MDADDRSTTSPWDRGGGPRRRVRRLGPAATLSCLALLTTLGCTHYYVPEQVPVEEGRIPGFTVTEPVELINAQPSSEPILAGARDGNRWMADRRAWTDTAIGVMQSELSRRGMPAGAGEARALELSITGANIHWGFATIRCITHLEVGTDGEDARSFEGNASSGLSLQKACRVAVARAVARVLSDERILGYLGIRPGSASTEADPS